MIIKNFMSGPLAVNCYFVGDEITKEAFIVDPGGFSDELVQYIDSNNFKILYIVLTHGHSDHTGGVMSYKEKYGAEVVAFEKEANLLENAAYNFSKEVFGAPFQFKADIYVNEENVLKVGDLRLKFLHTPGHTPGGMCILVGKHLFSGDTLFADSVGRTDFSYSSFDALMKGIHQKLFTLPDETRVYPGHMGETTIGHEKEYNPFV
jgi:hydroxyacylglutathione hydrolase